MNSMKALSLATLAVVGVGVVTAVVVGGGRAKRKATIPAGTELVAALNHSVSTEKSHAGDAVELRTVIPIVTSDGGMIPEGAVIRGSVVEAKAGGRVAGAPVLGLRFTELEVDGHAEAIAAEAFHVTGHNDATESAVAIGGGAVAGGLAGRVLGGKSGTLPGAVVGAAIGTGVAVSSEGDQVVLPEGQRLKIRLTGPVTVTYRPAPEPAPQ